MRLLLTILALSLLCGMGAMRDPNGADTTTAALTPTQQITPPDSGRVLRLGISAIADTSKTVVDVEVNPTTGETTVKSVVNFNVNTKTGVAKVSVRLKGTAILIIVLGAFLVVAVVILIRRKNKE